MLPSIPGAEKAEDIEEDSQRDFIQIQKSEKVNVKVSKKVQKSVSDINPDKNQIYPSLAATNQGTIEHSDSAQNHPNMLLDAIEKNDEIQITEKTELNQLDGKLQEEEEVESQEMKQFWNSSRIWCFRLFLIIFTFIVLVYTARVDNLDLEKRLAAPPLNGVIPNSDGLTKLIFAQDIDYPTYAFLGEPPVSDYQVEGFGKDFALGMAALKDRRCNFEIIVTQTDWANCWDSSRIGQGLNDGWYHACMTYTHTKGVRNRFGEFSNSILENNKPAGLLTRLVDGKPILDPNSDLSGVKIADVTGWAPTIDGLQFSKNNCSGSQFTNFEMVETGTYTPYTRLSGGDALAGANDIALALLMDEVVDAVWIYADQAKLYDCDTFVGTPEWDCDLWAGFGTSFAYLHTGIYEHAQNGTTLTLSRKGSGIADLINPCINKYMKTIQYKELCDSYGVTEQCYKNEFFEEKEEGAEKMVSHPKMATSEHADDGCSDGYCSCKSFE